MMNWAYTVLSSFRREGGGLKYLLHGVNKIHPGTISSARSRKGFHLILLLRKFKC